MVCAVSQNIQHIYYFGSYQGGVVMATSLWYLDLLVQSVPITTKIVSLNPTQVIQQYKNVCDKR
jgi:hypothetical protein